MCDVLFFKTTDQITQMPLEPSAVTYKGPNENLQEGKGHWGKIGFGPGS